MRVNIRCYRHGHNLNKYFAPFGSNRSDLASADGIRKRFPNAPYPSTLDPGQASPDELTDDGYLKYFEYEVLIDNLLSHQTYDVVVTAFDHGMLPASGRISESPISERVQTITLTGCCAGMRGNADGDSDDEVNVSDLVYVIKYIFLSGPAPSCIDEANVNGDPENHIDLSDISFLAYYMWREGQTPPDCPGQSS